MSNSKYEYAKRNYYNSFSLENPNIKQNDRNTVSILHNDWILSHYKNIEPLDKFSLKCSDISKNYIHLDNIYFIEDTLSNWINMTDLNEYTDLAQKTLDIINQFNYVKEYLSCDTESVYIPERKINIVLNKNIANHPFKCKKLNKHTNINIAQNIKLDSNIYRLIIPFNLDLLVQNNARYLEATVSISNNFQIALLYLVELDNICNLTFKSSIIPIQPEYNMVIGHTNNEVFTTIKNINPLFSNSIYVRPSIYAIIKIPNNKYLQSVKVSTKDSNVNINIWEGCYNCADKICIATGKTNNIIHISKAFNHTYTISKDLNNEHSNFLLIELPYVIPNITNIIGGEIHFKHHNDKDYDETKYVNDYLNTQDKTPCIKNIDTKTYHPSICQNCHLSFPIINNQCIESSFLVTKY